MYNPIKPYKNKILNLIKQTWENPYISVKENIYPVFKNKQNYFSVDHTDGIGTKGFYHWQRRTFKNAVIDVLAMNLNDLAMARAIPYKLQDHIIVPDSGESSVLKIMGHLAEECIKRKIAITGGETSHQDTINGMDISLTVSGIIKNQKLNQLKSNDILIGIKSSGLHSNGFTKVREIFGSEFRPEFVIPTKIYIDRVLELDKKININGMMHITGGAFTKLKQILPENCDVIITRDHKLKPQKIFYELYTKDVSDKDMHKTFNCGIGFIFSVSPQNLKKIKFTKDMAIIGKIVSGHGKIKIESMFSDITIKY